MVVDRLLLLTGPDLHPFEMEQGRRQDEVLRIRAAAGLKEAEIKGLAVRERFEPSGLEALKAQTLEGADEDAVGQSGRRSRGMEGLSEGEGRGFGHVPARGRDDGGGEEAAVKILPRWGSGGGARHERQSARRLPLHRFAVRLPLRGRI